MITKKIKGATSLKEYYEKLIKMKDSVPKPISNTEYHNIIRELMQECDSFTEFGMCQGPVIGAVMLMNPKKVRGYDITFEWFGLAKPFFDNYAKEHNIDFKVYQTDTSKCPVIDETDMLHIDSKHTYKHAITELKRHGHKVKKYILLHDTTYTPGVFKAVEEYITNINPTWKLVKRSEIGVGYTLIKRKTE